MSACDFQPYLSISRQSGGARKAIAWYKKVFGTQVKSALAMGKDSNFVAHAELSIGTSQFMLSDACADFVKTPLELGGTPMTFSIEYTKDSKAVYDAAVENGATVPAGREYKEQPWGWMAGTIVDPFGYQWKIGEDAKKWSDEEWPKHMGMKVITSQF